ncbi:MAG: tyrosine--tRNA ligase [Phycisphaerales bacterium]|nr:tyrosine--tRNA ligase [Phycisphaerales bacterium]
MPPSRHDYLEELRWRGLIHQATDEEATRAHLAESRHVYCGFDPTADSLTIGNLVPIMMLVHAQRAGHRPVVVMGGATGLIGDPSGKSAERTLQTREMVEGNLHGQRRIFERLLDMSGPHGAVIVNNLDWIGRLSFIDALRDIGKHFSVNVMIQKESVRERLHNRDQGISYTEFSYQLLQAYDFLHLRRELGVTVQVGGSDQWGNIVAGADLVRRVLGEDAFGVTAPLVTKADGGKFGKTESGAIWLTADRTSPYAMYQFWLNADDRDVPRFLRIFTLLPRADVDALIDVHAMDPGARTAHRALARAATAMIHGDDEAQAAEKAAAALFSGDVASLPEASLREAFAEAPSSDHSRALLGGEGVSLVDLLVEVGLAKSKRESREFLANGSVSVNGEKVGPDDPLTPARLLHGGLILLRRGKKNWHVTRWG